MSDISAVFRRYAPGAAQGVPERDDQNHPFTWGMAKAIGTLGEKSDAEDMPDPRVESADQEVMKHWKYLQELNRKLDMYRRPDNPPAAPFVPPPGRRLDI